MVHKTFIPEELIPYSLLEPQLGGAGDQAYILPKGVRTVYVVAHVIMGDNADCVLVPKTSDDATGTNAAVLAANVPIWVNRVRETSDAKNYTISPNTGTFVVVFAIPANIVPDGKYVGLSMAANNNGNLVSAIAYTDSYFSL